jgi:hypothetical protein
MKKIDSELLNEKWSAKYKKSINCSHPKGFSQKAHCAGKKKHNEDITMEAVCPDCGMCKTHGNMSLNEIKKGQKDSNGFTKCWPGKHAEGTKKGRNGGQVRNCVPNESQGVAEDWNKVNHHDKTNGLSQKAVNAYRHEHPGSKLKTAVTTKPSKLKKGSKAAKRRKSFCARMGGNKGPMKKPNGKPTPKALALRRWNCESLDYKALQDLSSRLEDLWEGAFNQIDIDRQEREQSNIFEVGRYKDGYWIPLKHHAGHEQAHFHAKSLKKKYPSMEIGVKSQDGQVELIGVGETTGNNTMTPWSDSGAKFKQMESDTMNKNYPFAGKAVGQKTGKAGQLRGTDAGKLGGKQPAQRKLVGGT